MLVSYRKDELHLYDWWLKKTVHLTTYYINILIYNYSNPIIDNIYVSSFIYEYKTTNNN